MFRRFASFKTRGYKEVQRLVPQTLRVTDVTGGRARKNVALAGLDVGASQAIKIVNIRPLAGHEPEVVVQVVDSEPAQRPQHAQHAPPAKQKQKKPTTKEIQISWSISENDLLGPKLTAVNSVLGRGHAALIKFQNKRHTRQPAITKEHLEARQLLVDKLEQRLEPAACVSKSGTLETTIEMLFKASQ